MNKREFDEVIQELSEHRNGVADEKRTDYTKGDKDVLANFKNVAESTGVTPLQVWLVYSQKHFDAISTYVKTGGQSESEPIKERFGDLLNYLELGWALIEEDRPETSEIVKPESVSFEKGQLVKIVKNKGHNYEIGEKVILVKHIKNNKWYVKNGDNWHQYVIEEEIEPIKSTERSAGI